MIRIRVMRKRRFDTSLPHINVGVFWVAAVPVVGSELVIHDDSREVDEVFLEAFKDGPPDRDEPIATVWVR